MAYISNSLFKIAEGTTIPTTPLLQKAFELARHVLTDDIYNHIVRSLLLGFIVADKIPQLKNRDREVHAVAAVLHDLGLPLTRSQASRFIVSHDKRFEVDGANAARKFLIKEGSPSEWDKHRLQLVWDAIALHAIGSINLHKEPEVQACALGIRADFMGPPGLPNGMLTWVEYEGCVQAYPRLKIATGFKENMLLLCCTKPQTTFDSTTGEWGKRYLSSDVYKPVSVQASLESSLTDLDAREQGLQTDLSEPVE